MKTQKSNVPTTLVYAVFQAYVRRSPKPQSNFKPIGHAQIAVEDCKTIIDKHKKETKRQEKDYKIEKLGVQYNLSRQGPA